MNTRFYKERIFIKLGTCAAAIQLCEMLKAEVVECIMLIEFVNLNWRSKVKAKTSGFIKLDA